MRRLIAALALAVGLAGLILHLPIGNGERMFPLAFYALPLPVAGLSILVAALLIRGRLPRRAVGLVALLVLGGWFFESCGWAYPVGAKWKAVTWNIARPQHPFQPLVALVKAERPDVMVLVESGAISRSQILAYEHALPGYQMVAESRELSCLVRGKILDSSVSALTNGSYAGHFHVKVGGDELNVFVADLEASPFRPRKPQLEVLAGQTRGRPRTIVLGDFNTPLESVYLDGMRASFSEVMDGPHRGFRETWFYGLPLLSIDQVWLSRDLEPRFASRRLTFASDHAPVVATFSVRR